MDITREYRSLVPSGGVYAVEIRDGKVITECGPLHYSEVTHDMTDLEFEPSEPWSADTEYTVLTEAAIQASQDQVEE